MLPATPGVAIDHVSNQIRQPRGIQPAAWNVGEIAGPRCRKGPRHPLGEQLVEQRLVRDTLFGCRFTEAAAEIRRGHVASGRLRLETQNVVDEPLDGGVPHAPHLVGREFQVGEVRGHGWPLYNEARAHRALGRLPLARLAERPSSGAAIKMTSPPHCSSSRLAKTTGTVRWRHAQVASENPPAWRAIRAGCVWSCDGRAQAARRVIPVCPRRCLSVSNSLSGRHWELDQVPSVGDLTDIVQLGTGHHVSVGEGQRRVALQRRVAAYLVGGGQTPGATQRCLNPGFSERIGIRDAQVTRYFELLTNSDLLACGARRRAEPTLHGRRSTLARVCARAAGPCERPVPRSADCRGAGEMIRSVLLALVMLVTLASATSGARARRSTRT